MKTDALSMTLLFDFYGDLLTEKQRSYFDQYYNQDLSLAEIAENEGVSRQGVYDVLRRTVDTLRRMEQTAGCVARDKTRRRAAETLREVAKSVAALDGGRTCADAIEAVCRELEEETNGV